MTTTELPTRVSRSRPTRRRRRSPHRRAIPVFVLPFGLLFTLFYALPVGYAVWESLLTVEREGTFGKARDVFGGFTQYEQVFSNGPFWSSVARVLTFGVVQVPIMLGLALLFALLLDSPLLRGKRFFRLAFFVPYAVPGVVAAIMWGFLYSPNLSPFSAVTERVGFLSADLVLWSMANVVTWVYVGYNMLIIYSSLLRSPRRSRRRRGSTVPARPGSPGRSRSRWSCPRSCSPRCSRSSGRSSCSPSPRCSGPSARR